MVLHFSSPKYVTMPHLSRALPSIAGSLLLVMLMGLISTMPQKTTSAQPQRANSPYNGLMISQDRRQRLSKVAWGIEDA